MRLVKLGCLGIVALMVLGFVVGGLRQATMTPEQKHAAAIQQEQAEKQAAAERDKAKERRAEEERDGDIYEAKATAPEFVKRYLKFPDDAEFLNPDSSDCGRTTINGKVHWIVRGKVKAKNAFGAALTHSYAVELFKNDPTHWKPYIVTFDNQTMLDMSPLYKAAADAAAEVEAEENAKQAAETAKIEKEKQTRAIKEAEEQAKWRTWTSGDYKTEAKFIKAGFGKITLEKRDGKTIEVSLDKLSPDDQDWIKNQGWKRK